MNSQKVIDIALGEVGYLEKSKSAYIRNPAVIWYKVDGAGYDNITKYAYEIDREDWYSGYKQYQPWCATFVDWCVLVACEWDISEAARLKNHGIYDAVVDYAIDQYKAIGQWFHSPQKGDQIFFSKANGVDPAHTGLVVDFNDTHVFTVEGNTSSDAGVEANGGAVCKKTYRRDYYRILGYGRPLYEEVEEVTIKDLMQLLKNASPEERRAIGKELDSCVYDYRVKMDVPGWAMDELQEAKDAGITDGTRPMTYSTRLEAAIMCKRAVKK